MTRPPEDWRRLAPADIAPHLDAEALRWRADLTWDVTESWKPIEPARAAGDLPGFVVRDGTGRIAGWSCFLLHRRTLQVAMIVADAPERVAALVESVLASPEAGRASTCTVCVREAAPGIGAALRVRGFDVATRYRYLSAPLGVPGPIRAALPALGRRGRARDVAPVRARVHERHRRAGLCAPQPRSTSGSTTSPRW